VRSFGLLAAVELVKDKAGPVLFDPVGEIGVICRDYAINKGLMVRAVRDAMIISPPLSFERSDIDHMVTILATALDRTFEDTTQQ
jgi:putrescine aminotransferase